LIIWQLHRSGLPQEIWKLREICIVPRLRGSYTLRVSSEINKLYWTSTNSGHRSHCSLVRGTRYKVSNFHLLMWLSESSVPLEPMLTSLWLQTWSGREVCHASQSISTFSPTFVLILLSCRFCGAMGHTTPTRGPNKGKDMFSQCVPY
jgi:hypothetical protein